MNRYCGVYPQARVIRLMSAAGAIQYPIPMKKEIPSGRKMWVVSSQTVLEVIREVGSLGPLLINRFLNVPSTYYTFLLSVQS